MTPRIGAIREIVCPPQLRLSREGSLQHFHADWKRAIGPPSRHDEKGWTRKRFQSARDAPTHSEDRHQAAVNEFRAEHEYKSVGDPIEHLRIDVPMQRASKANTDQRDRA
jgi:hypothetical protein